MDLMTVLRAQWDRALAVASLFFGIVFLIVGWVGVSGTAYFAEQLPYVVGNGIGGLFFLGVAGVLWLSADLRDEWHKLDRIEKALLSGQHVAPQAPETSSVPVSDSELLESPRRRASKAAAGAHGSA